MKKLSQGKHNKIVILISSAITIACPIYATLGSILAKRNIIVVCIIAFLSVLVGLFVGMYFFHVNYKPTRRQAWYLDEDVLLAGYTELFTFYPYTGLSCGFDRQRFSKADVGKTVFYDLDMAVRVCSNAGVVTQYEEN